MDDIVRAEELAARAAELHDPLLFVAAACASARAGTLQSVKLVGGVSYEQPQGSDPLDPERLLNQAMDLKDSNSASEVAAAVRSLRHGKFLTEACHESDEWRGTLYLFKATGIFQRDKPQSVPLPPVVPAEPLRITARADVYGRLEIYLVDPRGATICSNARQPAREMRCLAMIPRFAEPNGYSVRVKNVGRLGSRVDVYAN